MTVNVEVDERPLRELYLRPFERAVKEGGAWGIMSSYNRVAGEHAAENRRLLTDILRTEWGFDGYVVSDWFGVHEPVGAANAGLTLEMPAPVRVYGRRLVEAVERGDVTEATVDGLVRDLLTVMNRTKADERSCDDPEESVDDPGERALTAASRDRRHRAAPQRRRVTARPHGAPDPARRNRLGRRRRTECSDRPIDGWRIRQPHTVRASHPARRAHRPARARAARRPRSATTPASASTGSPRSSDGVSCAPPPANPACGSSTSTGWTGMLQPLSKRQRRRR